jgi:hypothetical protein
MSRIDAALVTRITLGDLPVCAKALRSSQGGRMDREGSAEVVLCAEQRVVQGG